MPNVVYEIPDIETSITRPVILEIARQLSVIVGIPLTARQLYPGDVEESYQHGSTMEDIAGSSDRERTKLPFKDQLRYSVTETTFQESMNLSQARLAEVRPFFLDRHINTLIRPVLAPTEVEIELAYRSKSKTKATQWKNSLESKLITYGDMNLHSAQCSFMIPLECIDTLMEIHTLRESVAGYGDTFGKYVSEHTSSKLTVVANQAGKKRALTMAWPMTRILGLYQFTVAPDKGDNESDGATWTTTFSYKFQFDKPIQCNMVYPVAVHNQMLDDRYQVIDTNAHIDQSRKEFSRSGDVSYFFEAQEQVHRQGALIESYRVPANDEYQPDNEVGSTGTLATVLCGVQEDSDVILDLKTIEEFEFHPDIVRYLQDSGDWDQLHRPYKCPYHVSLYKNGRLMDPTSITVTKDLLVKATSPLNLRDYHQIRISLVTDIDSVYIGSLRNLKDYPDAAVKTLLAMKVSMGDLKLLSPRIDFTKLMESYLSDNGPSMQWIHRNYIGTHTVMAFYVLTNKREHAPWQS